MSRSFDWVINGKGVECAFRGMGRRTCADLEQTAQRRQAGGYADLLPPAIHTGQLGYSAVAGALKIGATQCESIKLRRVLEKIVAKVSSGSSFYRAAAAFPQIFEFQWIEAIRTGEVSGKMAQVLLELNKQIRDPARPRAKSKAP